MVFLNRIYTRSGDAGETSLGSGERVAKTHPRIIAYGSVDETNAALGVAIALGNLEQAALTRLAVIQNDLFDLGGDLCIPDTEENAGRKLSTTEKQVAQLEAWIDEDTEQLEPLTSFVFPGGTPGAALLHQVRTVCRRSEIAVLELAAMEPVNPQAIAYLNRLSDLLFVMARMANDRGRSDVLWKPGGQSNESQPDK